MQLRASTKARLYKLLDKCGIDYNEQILIFDGTWDVISTEEQAARLIIKLRERLNKGK